MKDRKRTEIGTEEDLMRDLEDGWRIVGIIDADTTPEELRRIGDRLIEERRRALMPPDGSPVWDMLVQEGYRELSWEDRCSFRHCTNEEHEALTEECARLRDEQGLEVAEEVARQFVYAHGGSLYETESETQPTDGALDDLLRMIDEDDAISDDIGCEEEELQFDDWTKDLQSCEAHHGGATQMASRMREVAYATGRTGQSSLDQVELDRRFQDGYARMIETGELERRLDDDETCDEACALALSSMPNVRFRHALDSFLSEFFWPGSYQWADEIAMALPRFRRMLGLPEGIVYNNVLRRRMNLDSDPFMGDERMELLVVTGIPLLRFLLWAFVCDVSDKPVRTQFTERRKQVMQLKLEGKTMKEIGKEVGLSAATAKNEIRAVSEGESGIAEYDEMPSAEFLKMTHLMGTQLMTRGQFVPKIDW